MENYFDVKNIFIETKIKNIPKLIFKILSEILKTKLPPITDPVIPKFQHKDIITPKIYKNALENQGSLTRTQL